MTPAGEVLSDAASDGHERFTLNWPGKQKAARLARREPCGRLVDDPERSFGPAGAPHRFIEGDNLEVLRLLRPEYAGRVRLIYIDPPYNTGRDTVYRDNYRDPAGAYLKASGQRGRERAETDGRYHSRWLSMMYPRLVLARELSHPEGAVFVSIDDHEVHNLRLLMNEVWGEDCFKNCIVASRGVKNVQAQFQTVDSLAVGHEYLLFYARSPGARFPKLEIPLPRPRPGGWNNHWRGTERPTMRYQLFGIVPQRGQWRWGRARSEKAVDNYQRMLRETGHRQGDGPPPAERVDAWWREQRVDLLRLSATGKPEHYVPPRSSKLGSDLWTDLSPRGSGRLARLFGTKVFDNPKPVPLIRRLLGFATEPGRGDVVLDFFAGSCSTAEAVLEQNLEDGGDRSFVMVQLPEPLDPPLELGDGTRLETLADLGRERIRRAAADLGAGGVGMRSLRWVQR
ncbi:MAG: site-specific DNA-methyltransferase [Longimicrobiaceae bacterium]